MPRHLPNGIKSLQLEFGFVPFLCLVKVTLPNPSGSTA
jgi:hypothetical protein